MNTLCKLSFVLAISCDLVSMHAVKSLSVKMMQHRRMICTNCSAMEDVYRKLDAGAYEPLTREKYVKREIGAGAAIEDREWRSEKPHELFYESESALLIKIIDKSNHVVLQNRKKLSDDITLAMRACCCQDDLACTKKQ